MDFGICADNRKMSKYIHSRSCMSACEYKSIFQKKKQMCFASATGMWETSSLLTFDFSNIRFPLSVYFSDLTALFHLKTHIFHGWRYRYTNSTHYSNWANIARAFFCHCCWCCGWHFCCCNRWMFDSVSANYSHWSDKAICTFIFTGRNGMRKKEFESFDYFKYIYKM